MNPAELYFVRHGLAEERDPSRDDRKRPLTRIGRQRTRAVAKRLRALGFHVDTLLTSPLVRARQTADILVERGIAAGLEEAPELAPGGSLERWLTWLRKWRPERGRRLALVGHEPALGEWAERLVWGEVRHRLVLKKAGVVGLTLPARGSPVGRSLLILLAPPRFLS
jgi:phosphohistidine phosphatase